MATLTYYAGVATMLLLTSLFIKHISYSLVNMRRNLPGEW